MTTTSEQPTVTPQQVLACPMDPDTNDASASTVGGYLMVLLAGLWEEGEGFSGKRPFGTSGWEFEVFQALVLGELIVGEIDDDGFVAKADTETGDKLVKAALAAAVLVVPSN